MFTGLVQATGEIVRLVPEGPGTRLVIDAHRLGTPATLGDSVAVSGCCLTVVAVEDRHWSFEAGPETLRRTTLGRWKTGQRVNLERSLRASDQLGGHFVTGHVDGLGSLLERHDEASWSTFWFQAPPELLLQMASKGSISIDGVSLTLVDVLADRFSVALIPHTLAVTTLGQLQVGDLVNLETDILAKYVQRQLEFRSR